MKTNGRFATAVHVLALIAYRDGDCVSSECLSASVNAHPVMIRRLLLALRAARLVETRKGPRSGSRLGRSAGRITLAEVYRAVKGSEPFTLPRPRPNGQCPVGHGIWAVLKPVLSSAHQALERELERTTLAAVVEQLRTSAGGSTHPGGWIQPARRQSQI